MNQRTFEFVLDLMVEFRSVKTDTFFRERLHQLWVNGDFDISQLDKACQRLNVNIEDILSVSDGKIFAGQYKVLPE